jgi:hypothetical protein
MLFETRRRSRIRLIVVSRRNGPPTARFHVRLWISLPDVDLLETLLGSVEEGLTEIGATLTPAKKALKSANGIAAVPRYTNPSRVIFRISSPQLSQYANLIQGLDRLTVGIDTLWLSGLFSNRQRADAVYTWRNEPLSVGRRIVEIEARARDFARRQGKDAEIAAGDEAANSVVVLDEAAEFAGDEEEAE